MTLMTKEEAAAFLKFKNPNSLYNNKTIPRVHAGRLVRFVKEDLEQWLRNGAAQPTTESSKASSPMFRIKVRR